MVRILRGCDCGRQVILKVEAVSPGREIDRRVLTADDDAEVGLIPCVWSGFGPRARLSIQKRSRAGFWSDYSLVAGAGVQVACG